MTKSKLTYDQKVKMNANIARNRYKNAVRYYYYEWVPSYGFRQMGKTDGYDSLDELRQQQSWSIMSQQQRGLPVFIMKAKVIKIF